MYFKTMYLSKCTHTYIYILFNIYKNMWELYKNSNEYTKKYSWNCESYASKSYPWTKDKLVKELSVEIFISHWNSHIIWSLQQNVVIPVYNNKDRVSCIIDFVPTAVKHSWDFFFLFCFLVFHIDIYWLQTDIMRSKVRRGWKRLKRYREIIYQ